MKKNNIAHNCEAGIKRIASGNVINVSPGPNKKEFHNISIVLKYFIYLNWPHLQLRRPFYTQGSRELQTPQIPNKTRSNNLSAK
jgi:hypothetical protein